MYYTSQSEKWQFLPLLVLAYFMPHIGNANPVQTERIGFNSEENNCRTVLLNFEFFCSLRSLFHFFHSQSLRHQLKCLKTPTS